MEITSDGTIFSDLVNAKQEAHLRLVIFYCLHHCAVVLLGLSKNLLGSQNLFLKFLRWVAYGSNLRADFNCSKFDQILKDGQLARLRDPMLRRHYEFLEEQAFCAS